MDMDNVEFDREPPGNLSTLVIAFGGWIDAGQVATGAVPATWSASSPPRGWPRSSPRSSSCSRRNGPRCGSGPTRAVTRGGRAASSSRGQPRTGRTVCSCSAAPSLIERWRTYTRAFLDVVERCGVRRIVSMGALLAGAPHTRPVAVTARAPTPRGGHWWRPGHHRPPTLRGPDGDLHRGPGRGGGPGHGVSRLHGTSAALSTEHREPGRGRGPPHLPGPSARSPPGHVRLRRGHQGLPHPV